MRIFSKKILFFITLVIASLSIALDVPTVLAQSGLDSISVDSLPDQAFSGVDLNTGAQHGQVSPGATRPGGRFGDGALGGAVAGVASGAASGLIRELMGGNETGAWVADQGNQNIQKVADALAKQKDPGSGANGGSSTGKPADFSDVFGTGKEPEKNPDASGVKPGSDSKRPSSSIEQIPEGEGLDQTSQGASNEGAIIGDGDLGDGDAQGEFKPVDTARGMLNTNDINEF